MKTSEGGRESAVKGAASAGKIGAPAEKGGAPRRTQSKAAREAAIIRDLLRASAILSRRARCNGASRREIILGHLAVREGLIGEGTVEAPFTQGKLASIMGITPQTLGETLGKMEAEGMVVRDACTTDKRSLYVLLTAAGRVEAETIMEGRRVFAHEALAGLDAGEQNQLAAALAKLNAVL